MGVAQRIVLGVSIFAVVVLGFSSAAPAGRRVPPQKIALAAVARLQAAGRIDPADAARYRKAISRAVALIPRVPASRATPLRSQLAQAAAIAPKLTAPRALAVFSQLEVNDDWFANHGPAASQTDITDADGVVYRYFSGGFEFHPLGNFAALNADALAKNVTATTRLANALADRAVPEAAGGAGWEYYFDYGGGRAPWTSGFAQVVAAQSFARAAKVDTADSARLLAAARSAYHAVPGRLVRDTSFGPWIRLYSFNHAVVLNAQLQAAISLASYAKLTSDSQAGTLAAEMTTAAARALPSFTTGYWSYYELPGEPSPVSYQNYVVELLQTLARADDRFAPAATEFAGFGTKPPAFRLGDAGVGAVNFWVSKPSSVRVSALGRDRWLSVSGGWHTVSWQLPVARGDLPGDDPRHRLGGERRLGRGAADRSRRCAAEEAAQGSAEHLGGRCGLTASARRRCRASAAGAGRPRAVAGARRGADDPRVADGRLGAGSRRDHGAQPASGRDEPGARSLSLRRSPGLLGTGGLRGVGRGAGPRASRPDRRPRARVGRRVRRVRGGTRCGLRRGEGGGSGGSRRGRPRRESARRRRPSRRWPPRSRRAGAPGR